jgi:hypothetical protein
MINSSKLLTNRSSGTTVLSRKSVTNIGIIREDVIKVDKLLKDRLVLSKVREGIERQNQERLRRVGREETLEKDDDRDDDIDLKKKDPKPKRGGGLIAFLIGGVVSTIGFFALKFLPQLASLGKFFKVIFKSFTFVAGGALTALGGFISMFNQSSTQLKGIDKDLTKEKKINNVFEDFTNSLRSVVYALILGGASALGIRAFRKKGMMSEAAITDLLQEMGQDARRGKTGMKGGFMEMMTEDELLDYLRGKQIREFERDFGYLDDDMVKPQTTKSKPKEADFSKVSRETGRRKSSPQKIKTEELLQRELEFSRTGRVSPDQLDVFDFEKKIGRGKKQLVKDVFTKDKFKKQAGREVYSDIRTGIDIDLTNVPDIEEIVDTDEFDILNKEMSETVFKGDRPIKPKVKSKKVKVKPDTFLGKGKRGLGKFLSELGIGGSLKPIRKFISESIGAVPLIGDLIAFLLDVFVFGEPPGRAAFMAIGSLALGGLLAGVGSALGPVGTILGGIVGGVGGDILGGIAYDLFFKNGRDSSRPSFVPATKGVTRTFEDGGYVNPDLPRSNFKPLVNSVDKSTEIRSTPFYNKTTAGRVSFVPFPLVIPSKEQSQQEEQLIAMGNKASETRTFSNLYKR